MKPINLLSLFALVVSSLTSLNASSVDLVNSNFSTGIDGWRMTKTPGRVVWGGAENPALVYTSPNSYRGIFRRFKPVQLKNVGDSITFSFGVKATATNADTPLGLRVSVGNFGKMNKTDKDGYVFVASWGNAAAKGGWLYSPSAFDGGTAIRYGTDGKGVGIPFSGGFHEVSASITRESPAALRFAFTVNGSGAGDQLIEASSDTFDVIAIVSTAASNGFDLNGVKVVYTPVP